MIDFISKINSFTQSEISNGLLYFFTPLNWMYRFFTAEHSIYKHHICIAIHWSVCDENRIAFDFRNRNRNLKTNLMPYKLQSSNVRRIHTLTHTHTRQHDLFVWIIYLFNVTLWVASGAASFGCLWVCLYLLRWHSELNRLDQRLYLE